MGSFLADLLILLISIGHVYAGEVLERKEYSRVATDRKKDIPFYLAH